MEWSRSISSASDLRSLPLAIIVLVMECLLKANREWIVASSTSRAVARGAAYAGSTGNQNGELESPAICPFRFRRGRFHSTGFAYPQLFARGSLTGKGT